MKIWGFIRVKNKNLILFSLFLLFYSFAWSEESFIEEEDFYPRIYASKDSKNFTYNHEWEGVYGDFELCNALDPYGECDKQKSLSIYDCESLDAQNTLCTLGIVSKQAYSPLEPLKRKLHCETSNEVEILINGNTAKPTKRYFENKCKHLSGKENEECLKAEFALIKVSDKGINFSSSKTLDLLSCSQEKSKGNALGLSGFYPNVKASFNCQAQGLSRVEKGICNSAQLAKADKSMNTLYNFAMSFAFEQNGLKENIKQSQLKWLKSRNLECNAKDDIRDFTECILDATTKRTIELKDIIKEHTYTLSVVFKNPTGEVKIYEEPSIRSSVITTFLFASLEIYGAFLAEEKSHNGFKKIILLDLEENATGAIVGFVRELDIAKIELR